jgi:CPA1 family monovalent cation:H+ antiporter
MRELEQVLALFVAAVILAGAARRVGAPYPVFLAIGGALLALLPSRASFTLPPELALALFVAPVLLDAAYDTSLRDLKETWRQVAGLVVVAVGLTTIAVATVTRALMPQVSWAPAVALGAIVAPPDAVAATAVLGQLRPPHRILTILGGESLLNDATALLIYRLAVGAVATGTFAAADVAPAFLLAVVGSVIAGPLLGGATLRILERVQHVPTAVILQFVMTFGVWIFAESVGLSGVLTMVCFAISVAQTAPARTPARVRIPTYAVWESVVFALNILAFIFIGLQIRPILESLDPSGRRQYFIVAAAIVGTVIVVRIAWQLSMTAIVRWRHRSDGSSTRRPPADSTTAGGLLIGWSGMRGIVSLAGALALPAGFPHRDLIVLAAFSVVLGPLVIQGLTLKPLLRALHVEDDDLIGREVRSARARALRAGLASLGDERSAAASTVRHELSAHLARDDVREVRYPQHGELHRRALQVAREEVLRMRASNEIGDDAFHQVEEDLDWLEMAGGTTTD